jgi:hypothetical protein
VVRLARRPLLVVAAFVMAIAFWRGFGLFRFYDDWYFAREADRAVRHHAFVSFIFTPAEQHWSPLWQAFDFLNAWTIGWQSDALIRSAIVVLVFIGLAVFSLLTAQLQLSPAATIMGLAVLGLHHLNGTAYYSFDCYSQIAADLCTWSSLTLILMVVTGDRDSPQRRGHVIAPVLLFTVGLLVKEQGLGALAGATVLAVWFTAVERVGAAQRSTVWSVWAAMLAVGVAFALLRLVAGRWLAQPYELCLTCVPGNLGMFLGALALPLTTVYAYPAIVNPWSSVWTVVITALGASVVCLTLGMGVAASARARRAALVIALAIATLFPIVMLARVGELHAHTAVFWYALLVAMAFDGWAERVRTWGRARMLLMGMATLYVIALAASLRINLNEMRATGERAALWLSTFREAVRDLPAGSTVLVRGLENVKAPGDYSLYRLTTPGMLLYEGNASLQFVSPAGVTIVDEDDRADYVVITPRPPGSTTFVVDFGGGALSWREHRAPAP